MTVVDDSHNVRVEFVPDYKLILFVHEHGYSGSAVPEPKPPGWRREHQIRPPTLETAWGGVLTEQQRESQQGETSTATYL